MSLTSGTVTSVSSANSYLTVTNGSSTPSLAVNVGTGANTVAAGDDSRITGAFQSATTMSGDLSGTLPSPTVVTVGAKTAAEIATSVTDTTSATSVATASTIVRRDGSGNSSFTTASATNFNGRNFLFPEATDTYKVTMIAPASLATNYTFTLPVSGGTSGYVLSTNGSGATSWVATNAGTVTGVTGTAPVTVTGTTAPVVSMAAATGSADGYLTSANWTTFNNKLGTATAHSGDVSGAYNAMSVDKIKGTAVTITSITSGNFLKYNGTAWVNSTPAISDITNLSTSLSTLSTDVSTANTNITTANTNISNLTTAVSNKLDQSQMPAACAAGETLAFYSPTGSWYCSTITISADNISGKIRPELLYNGVYKYSDGTKSIASGDSKDMGRQGVIIEYTDTANEGKIFLPELANMEDGFKITIQRKFGTNLIIEADDSAELKNMSSQFILKKYNLSSVTLQLTKDTKSTGRWKIINEAQECSVGLPCGPSTNNIYVGQMNGYQYFTTRGNCNNKTNICDDKDDAIQAEWSSSTGLNTGYVKTNSISIASGLDQSESLTSTYDDVNAALFCKSLDLDKVKDWYLPSIAEFELLLQNKANIKGFFSSFDENNEYWTSTESSSTNAIKYVQKSFGFAGGDKTGVAKVRCVRRF